VDGSKLVRKGDGWESEAGRQYGEVHGIPVLLRPDTNDTIPAMAFSRRAITSEDDPFRLDTLDMNEQHRAPLRDAMLNHTPGKMDPVVAWMVAATCGNLYLNLVGRLPRYPVPKLRLGEGAGAVFVDLGCNWGRWCIAAAREGFSPVGIDPQLGAVLAAKRVAEQLGVKAHFICGDARHLPLRPGVADVVFSYSVLQHFCREDVSAVIDDARQVLKPGGRFLTQMPNVFGLRCMFQWARRGFTDGSGFDVRYWTPGQLHHAFEKIGPVQLETDCFFGIGLQPADADLMAFGTRWLLKASEGLRRAGFPTWLADSVYVNAIKEA
jgi:2-polyprenyl-3-methyl-5-hydroxy-6-metoxy-1,4-benzoquinol methylase